MMRAVATLLLASFLLPTGAEDMPTLNWVGRKDAVRADKDVVMKILREDKSLSYFAPCLQTTNAACKYGAENILVHGDNLEALKALLPFYAGRVKCIYIDPPYNTKNAFPDYDDNLEHSIWLDILYPRLKLLREFLSEDGCIWISIDDHECAYLKVICDEKTREKPMRLSWAKSYHYSSPLSMGMPIVRMCSDVVGFPRWGAESIRALGCGWMVGARSSEGHL